MSFFLFFFLFSNPSRRSSGRRDGWSGGKQKRRVLHSRGGRLVSQHEISVVLTVTSGHKRSAVRRVLVLLRCRRVGHGLERTFCLPPVLFSCGLRFLGSDRAVRATEKRKRAVAVRFGRPESLEIFAKGHFYSDENKIRDLQHVWRVRCVENAYQGEKIRRG